MGYMDTCKLCSPEMGLCKEHLIEHNHLLGRQWAFRHVLNVVIPAIENCLDRSKTSGEFDEGHDRAIYGMKLLIHTISKA